MDTLRIIILFITLIIATITDIAKGKIYNILTIPVCVFGIIMSIIQPYDFALSRPQSVMYSLAGFMIPLVIFWIPYRKGWFGGGDVKLMCAVGSLMGYIFCINALIYSFACGFFGSIVVMLHRRIFWQKIKDIATSLYIMNLSFGRIDTADKKSVYPYEINFLIGIIIIIIFGDRYWIIH
ncbi:MAG: A24 family peptidase [Candidatus Hydrogenedentota bacterium]